MEVAIIKVNQLLISTSNQQLRLYNKAYIMINYMKELFYTSPEVEIHEIQAEGVLCASNERFDEYEGEW